MTYTNRDEIIEALTRMLADVMFPPEVYGEIGLDNPLLEPAHKALGSYTDDFLTDLYASAVASANTHWMLAFHGKSESWIKTYRVIEESNQRLFDSDTSYSNATTHYDMGIRSEVNSLVMYPELPYEDTEDYYHKVVAITGVTVAIQRGLPDTEAYDSSSHRNARFLSYTVDPADTECVDKIARITSDDLVELILSRPDDWVRIADIVVERETDDTRLIRMILDGNDTLPLTKGII